MTAATASVGTVLHYLPPRTAPRRAETNIVVKGEDGVYKSVKAAALAGTVRTSPARTIGPGAHGYYPADLGRGTGKVLQTAPQHLIFANCATTIANCWGDPARFLADLNVSTFVHLTDQYVGTTANRRYPVGQTASVKYTTRSVMYDADIQAIVHAFAKSRNIAGNITNGAGNVFHVFLPKGQDLCFDHSQTDCYSPDESETFTFCAYHGAVQFPDTGWLIYSAEPFQNVSGCQVSSAVNSMLIDSTDSVLGHETFEAITDPLYTPGWIIGSGAFAGYEVADICSFIEFPVLIGTTTYSTQLEYSNAVHACTDTP